MLILSEYKDIYDHLAYIYGVDNNIVYNRPYYTVIDDKDAKIIKEFINSKHTDIFTRFYLQDRMMDRYLYQKFGYLILFGQFVPVIGTLVDKKYENEIHIGKDFFEYYKFEFCTKESFKKYAVDVCTYYFNINKNSRKNQRLFIPSDEKILTWFDTVAYKVFPELLGINDKYNQPIMSSFITYGENNLCYTPILSSVSGFNKKFPSEKLYQDIYNFLIKNKKNVDLDPPVEIDNISKIEKAGFDKKTSFRHPVK